MKLKDFYWISPEVPDPEAFEERLQGVLDSWERTPYHVGWQKKGMGVDCVRFVCAVLDELRGCSHEITTLPNDASMHSREGAIKVMRTIRRLYMPNKSILDGSLEPADIIVIGPSNGGPGHALIVGLGELWHATKGRVKRTGLSYVCTTHSKIFRVYRSGDKHLWR